MENTEYWSVLSLSRWLSQWGERFSLKRGWRQRENWLLKQTGECGKHYLFSQAFCVKERYVIVRIYTPILQVVQLTLLCPYILISACFSFFFFFWVSLIGSATGCQRQIQRQSRLPQRWHFWSISSLQWLTSHFSIALTQYGPVECHQKEGADRQVDSMAWKRKQIKQSEDVTLCSRKCDLQYISTLNDKIIQSSQ